MSIYDLKFVQTIIDFFNFFRFRRTIRREIKNPDSKFNTLDMKRNWLGNIVYVQINCKDDDLMNFDYDYDAMLKRKIQPHVEYLSSELGWGDYLVPQVSNFVDDDGDPTLSYGILFIFSGYNMNMTQMFLLFLFFTLLILGVVGVAAWLIF